MCPDLQMESDRGEADSARLAPGLSENRNDFASQPRERTSTRVVIIALRQRRHAGCHWRAARQWEAGTDDPSPTSRERVLTRRCPARKRENPPITTPTRKRRDSPVRRVLADASGWCATAAQSGRSRARARRAPLGQPGRRGSCGSGCRIRRRGSAAARCGGRRGWS